MSKKQLFIIFFLFIIVFILAILNWYYPLNEYLTLNYLKSSHDELIFQYHKNPWCFISVFMMIYIVTTGLSIPGATVLTVGAGAIFGVVTGVIIVSFASTIGATIAFLIARTLLKGWVQSKYGQKLKIINEGVKKEGSFYLFSLRLVPAFPFFLINILMGLTPIKTLTYYFVSQIGMLPGAFVYVFAGTQLGSLKHVSDIMSFKMVGVFILLGAFPLVTKKVIDFIRVKHNPA